MVADALASGFPGFRAQPAITLVQGGQGDAATVLSYAGKLHAVPGLTVTAPRYLGKNLWGIESCVKKVDHIDLDWSPGILGSSCFLKLPQY